MKTKLGFFGILFISIGLLFFVISCATIPPAEEKKADPAKKEAVKPAQAEAPTAAAPMKWASEKDGMAKEGIFKRTAAPAFTFEYPTNWTLDELKLSNVFSGKDPAGLPVVTVGVDRIPEGTDPKEFLQGYAQLYAKELENEGTDVKILSNEPTDKYAPFPGQKIEIEWNYAGSFALVSFIHAVVKEGYIIGMGGHTGGDPGSLETIFDSVDFES